MGLGNIPPTGPRGGVGGVQGPGEIPQQAKDDVNQMTAAYEQLGDIYAAYLQETDPSKKQMLENQMQSLLARIGSLCRDLDTIKPPLPNDILAKTDDTYSAVRTILQNMDQATGADFFKLGLQIGALNQLINP
jgi:hypothetical protein